MRAMSLTAQQGNAIVSQAEMSTLFQAMREDAQEARQDAKDQRAEHKAEMLQHQAEHKADIQHQKAEHKVEVTQMRAEMAKMRDELRAELTPAPPQELISADQLAALQARIESLHAAQLLTDEEFFALEDLCADYLEVQASASGVLTHELVYSNPAFGEAAKLAQLIVVSEGLASDAGFARQARRKFV